VPNRISKTLRDWAAFRAGIPPVLAAFAENERRDRRALEALQVERLKNVLVHADENVPFWRRRFARYGVRPEAVRSLADLRALPPLEERDLRDVGADLLAGGKPDPSWLAAHGLGEERAKIAVWLDGRARRERLADELRHVGWLGLDWRAPRAALAGRSDGGEALPKDGGKLKARLLSGVWLHPARAEAEGETFFENALAAKAELLTGPPGALLRLPEIDPQADGVTTFRPSAVIAWGECLGDDRRARIEERLQTPVYEAYRTRELGEIAFECDARNGLHVSMERVAIDFVRDGRTVPDGEDGEIYLTALDNRSMPLFRYRIGDVGVRIPEKTCPCGRTSERILLTDGRASELVTSPAGQRIHGEWFEWLLEGMPGVSAWRVVQERPEHLTLEVVRGGGWKEENVAKLRAAVAEVDAALVLDVRAVDAIYVRTDGRRSAVASRAPLSWDPPTPAKPATVPAAPADAAAETAAAASATPAESETETAAGPA
jgi:phenylacetate-CoA ligase